MTTQTPTVTVAELRTDDADDVAASYRVAAAALAADLPDFPPLSWRAHTVGLRVPPPGNRELHWLASVDGEVVGRLSATLPILDNLDNMEIDLTVHPDHRRRGVGCALYGQAVRAARAEGRSRLFGETVESLPGGAHRSGAGSAFAAAVGASAANTEVRRRLDVPDVPAHAYEDLLGPAWAKAAGYSLVQWSDRVPDAYVDDVARLGARLMVDAPMGDLEWDREAIDAARVRDGEAVRRQKGTRCYSTGLRHDGTSRLVSLTALAFFDGIPDYAWQLITLVDPAHRGHRLGLVGKIENLRYTAAAEPALRTVGTWNATVNDHMVRINDAMGFQPVDSWVNWQIEVPVGLD